MTKLCPRGKAAAKRKFKVYPSAYANAYASKICAGKIKDPSGTKRKDFRGPKPAGANEGVFVKKPKFHGNKAKTGNPPRLSTEYRKKKKAYDDLVGNKPRSDQRFKKFQRPGAKKGALMIIIGVGKKKKPVKAKLGAAISAIGAGAGVIGAAAGRANKRIADKAKAEKRDIRKVEHMTGKNKNKFKDMRKKAMGGMTAGSMSGMGTLQKARMMKTGGGFDAGTPGKLRDIGTRYESDGIRFKPGKGPKMTPDRKKRLQDLIKRKTRSEKIKSIGKSIAAAASPITGAMSAGKKLIDKYKSRKTKESSSGTGGASQRGRQNRRPVKKIPVMEARRGGDAKIKKVITGLNKASALHKSQAKSLQTVVGKSVGGMADYYKDLM